MQSRLHDLEEQAVRERARAKERDLEYTSQTGQLTSQLHEAAEQARRSEEKVECVRSRVQVAESHADGLEELLGIARAQVERLRTTVANTTSEKARQAARAVGEYLLVNCVHQ
jgi:chromosome segregation ATPase